MIMTLLVVAFTVIGSLEWLKGLVDAIKAKSWGATWPAIVVAGVAIGSGMVLGSAELFPMIGTGLASLAVIQLGYQLVVKGVFGWLMSAIKKP